MNIKKPIDFRGTSKDALRAFPADVKRYASVWDAIEDTPSLAENMKLRSILMMALEKRIEQLKLTQEQAAKLLGVTQPRISDLMRGKINLFALDVLVNMTTSAGLHVDMRVSKIKKAA